MLERYSVDSFAAEITRQLQRAAPDPKLVRRFFRSGRRDGKRQLDAMAVQRFVTEGVNVAASKLCEDYLAAAQGLEVRRTALVEQHRRLKADGDGERDAGTPLGAMQSSAPMSGGPSLAPALDVLRASRLRAATARRQAAIEATAQELASVDGELRQLPGRHRQLIDSCFHTGKLLWARYCIGYGIGRAKRGGPEDEEDPNPAPAIEFSYPRELSSIPAAEKPDEVGDHAGVPSAPPVEEVAT